MARIQQYEAQVGQIGEVNTQRASGISAGSGLQAAGQGVADLGVGIEQHAVRTETADIYKTTSDAHVATQDLIKNLQEPIDDNGVQKIIGTYSETIDKAKLNISTPQASEHFEQIKAADMRSLREALITKNAALTGKKQREDYETTTQNYSLVSFNQPDATTFKESVGKLHVLATQLSGENIALRDQLFKESAKQLVESNFQGNLLSKNAGPEYAKGLVDSGMYDQFIDGKEKAKLIEMAESHSKAKQADDIGQMKKAKEVQKMQSDTAANTYFDQAMQGEPVAAKILTDPTLTREDKVWLSSNINKVQTLEVKQNANNVMSDLMARISSPVSDPNHISDVGEINKRVQDIGLANRAKAAKYLESINSMKGTTDGNNLTAFSESAKSVYMQKDKITGMPTDQYGSQRYADAMTAANEKIADYKKRGQPIAPLFQPNNPDSLYKLLTPPTRSEQRQNLRSLNQGGAPSTQSAEPKRPPPKSLEEVTARLKEKGL